MHQDNKDASQDAARHRKDALHHKAREENGQNSDDPELSEPGQQPEIPKVGSRDAPGG
jgi:hypothetical protein